VNSNVSGQAYALTVLTPILPGQEHPLRAYLEGLSRQDSPLARLPRVHFGRWVILEDFHNEREQPKKEGLGSRYLLFTTCSDGSLDDHLDELCRELAPEAREIWGRCAGSPDPPEGEALKRYLTHNQLKTGFFAAAYPQATVQDVQRSLDLRQRMIDLAVRTQGMDAAQLQNAVRAELGAR
jgi:hypothetical protein